MPTIEVDAETHRYLEFAARVSRSTTGQVVARLVAQASEQSKTLPTVKPNVRTSVPEDTLPVYADYDSHRTYGTYYRRTGRVEITCGPLDGTGYKTPTGAARAVVRHYNPKINPNRNGWTFWIIDDGRGTPLDSVRH